MTQGTSRSPPRSARSSLQSRRETRLSWSGPSWPDASPAFAETCMNRYDAMRRPVFGSRSCRCSLRRGAPGGQPCFSGSACARGLPRAWCLSIIWSVRAANERRSAPPLTLVAPLSPHRGVSPVTLRRFVGNPRWDYWQRLLRLAGVTVKVSPSSGNRAQRLTRAECRAVLEAYYASVGTFSQKQPPTS